ncbi:MAG TPA: shikimate kinase [Acidimicrobiales bacterium]|nr:shikimate kinase [Acidimicrobiales bacterium]
MAELLFLVGMMGAGKSTVGRLLAQHLGWDFVDTDAEISARTGRNVGDLFTERGEAAFREEERRAVGDVLARRAPAVVSVGGGAVVDEGNRRAMRDGGTVVWLRADPAVLAARVADEGGRPLLAGAGPAGARDELARIAGVRQVWYEEVATAVVDVDELTPEQASSAVLAAAGLA